jgi:hypothetical protein
MPKGSSSESKARLRHDNGDVLLPETDGLKRVEPAKTTRQSSKRLDLIQLARQKLNEKVVLPTNGRRVTKTELSVISLVNNFAKTGDLKTYNLLYEMLQKNGGSEVIYLPPPDDPSVFTDNELLEAFFAAWEF